MSEKKDNLIQFKDLQSDQEYASKQIYNIQEDLRLILNVRIPELKTELIKINTHVSTVNNNVTSLGEVIKLRDEKMNLKVEKIDKHNNNLMWLYIILSAALVSAHLFLR